MGFSREEYWGGLPCPPPGDLPNPGMKPAFPDLQTDYFPTEPPGKQLTLTPTIRSIFKMEWVVILPLATSRTLSYHLLAKCGWVSFSQVLIPPLGNFFPAPKIDAPGITHILSLHHFPANIKYWNSHLQRR